MCGSGWDWSADAWDRALGPHCRILALLQWCSSKSLADSSETLPSQIREGVFWGPATVVGCWSVIDHPLLIRRVDAEVGFDPVEA